MLDGNGRQTALTPNVAQKLVAEIRQGRWPQMAAVRCGVAPETLLKWLERGMLEDAVEPYMSFTQQFLLAEADFCAELEEVLLSRALGREEKPKDGRMRPDSDVARYLLERRLGILWGGKGALSAIETVSNESANKRVATRQKAQAFLDRMTDEQRDTARRAGFILPDKPAPTLAETGRELPDGSPVDG